MRKISMVDVPARSTVIDCHYDYYDYKGKTSGIIGLR